MGGEWLRAIESRQEAAPGTRLPASLLATANRQQTQPAAAANEWPPDSPNVLTCSPPNWRFNFALCSFFGARFSFAILRLANHRLRLDTQSH